MNKKFLLIFIFLIPCFLHAEPVKPEPIEAKPIEDAPEDAEPVKADYSVKVYGYIKLDVEYFDKNVGSAPSPPPTFTPLSTDKSAQHGELIIDARETRVGVETSRDFNDIKIAAVVEGDFFTNTGSALTENGRGFRLRLAYGRAFFPSNFSFMAGQYWSLLMNSSLAQPILIDFNGPVGALFAREPQFRVAYLKDLCNDWGSLHLQADIEKHSSSEAGHTNSAYFRSTAQGSEQKLPLFVGKISWLNKPLSLEVGGCGTQTTVTKNTYGSQLKKGVWGAQFTVQWKLLHKLALYGSARYLVGLSRLSNGDFLDAVINDFNRLCPVRSLGWYAGFNWVFREHTSLNGVYGWEKASRIPNSTFSGNTKGFFQSIHFNCIHEFLEHWKAGIEYQRFETKTFNGIHGHVDMLHFGIYYFF